jgi:hypothetical protein
VTPSVINTPEELSHARYLLELFLLGGSFQLFEDHRLISSVSQDNVEAEISYGKLIISCWGEGWSRSWRVTGLKSDQHNLKLQCAKQMGRVTCSVELRRGEANDKASASRHEFASKLASIVETNLPNLKIESAVTARDDYRHFSGIHTRLIIKDRNRVIAGIGVCASESQADIDAVLGAGIIWLDSLRKKSSISRLMIFAPRGKTATITARLTAVKFSDTEISLYEVDEKENSMQPIAPFDQGDLADNFRRVARRVLWPDEKSLNEEATSLLNSIIKLAPDLIEKRYQGNHIALSIRGLEFARLHLKTHVVEFGLPDNKKKSCSAISSDLEQLVKDIISRRTVDSDCRGDSVFRSQSERWLESIILQDVTVIDPTLDRRAVYSQVPAYRGEQRSYIDLLAVTRAGRLVVIELKVSEDAELPFQGLDYWQRVEWHRSRGDFQRRGYFKEINLSNDPPLLYLVAPIFRFHATTRLIAGCIESRVPVYRIGINDDWRSGVRVLLTEKINSGQ